MKQVKVKRGMHGLGLFLLEDAKRGERIVEYAGKYIDDAEADRIFNRYIFEVAKNVNIDGSSRKNLARYVNHSCRPNCEDLIRSKRVFYVARRKIKAGEELTVDYGKTYYDFYIAPYGCRCSATRHRKARTPAK